MAVTIISDSGRWEISNIELRLIVTCFQKRTEDPRRTLQIVANVTKTITVTVKG